MVLHTQEENSWARAIVGQAIASKTHLGSKKFRKLIAEYKDRFGKDMQLKNFTSWFGYLKKTMNGSKAKTKTVKRGGRKTPHSKEEIEWAQNKIRLMESIGKDSISQLDLLSQFKTTFGRELTFGAMYAWLKDVLRKEKGQGGKGTPVHRVKRVYRKKGKDLISQLMDKDTAYLLLINGLPLTFSTDEALKEAIGDPNVVQAISDYKLFKIWPLEIKREVTVSIGNPLENKP